MLAETAQQAVHRGEAVEAADLIADPVGPQQIAHTSQGSGTAHRVEQHQAAGTAMPANLGLVAPAILFDRCVPTAPLVKFPGSRALHGERKIQSPENYCVRGHTGRYCLPNGVGAACPRKASPAILCRSAAGLLEVQGAKCDGLGSI